MKILKNRKLLIALLLIITVMSLMIQSSAKTVTVGETGYDLGSFEAADNLSGALDYVDSYKDNVGSDENFAQNLEEALATVRQHINLYATFWALLPAVIAIALALITKEVYSSLFIGILSGAIIYANFNFEVAYNAIVKDAIINTIADVDKIGILMFLIVLGIIVVLINKAGGSAAYGKWASEKIKTKRGALLATFGLGCLIFVDDYFNCLTVGNVMRPVTDKHKISRAKLAYIIDATAAPICMIAPISSWAAAVIGVVEGTDGFALFINAIPYNFYSLLTIVAIIAMAVFKIEFGPMKKHEQNALDGDLFTSGSGAQNASGENTENPKSRVYDLVIPLITLIVCCILGMIYTGYAYGEATNLQEAFANCNAALGLSMGSLIALLLIVVYYIVRRVLTFRSCMEAIPQGFKTMVPAILILTFAWALSTITGMLGAKVFVAEIVRSSQALELLLPALVFAIAIGLSFATGTSWGTFGILLPIVVAILPSGSELLIISISACLAGAVCGDHCSPISDTTIMASTGAECEHINHVSTQLPYALTVAGVSLVSYVLAGLIQNVFIALPIAIVLMVGTLLIIKLISSKKKEK